MKMLPKLSMIGAVGVHVFDEAGYTQRSSPFDALKATMDPPCDAQVGSAGEGMTPSTKKPLRDSAGAVMLQAPRNEAAHSRVPLPWLRARTA